MVEKFIKFIEKSPFKSVFLKILKDILDNNLWDYDIKPIEWSKDMFRLRKWSVRFIFKRTPSWNKIVNINNRWDVYKWIDKK